MRQLSNLKSMSGCPYNEVRLKMPGQIFMPVPKMGMAITFCRTYGESSKVIHPAYNKEKSWGTV